MHCMTCGRVRYRSCDNVAASTATRAVTVHSSAYEHGLLLGTHRQRHGGMKRRFCECRQQAMGGSRLELVKAYKAGNVLVAQRLCIQVEGASVADSHVQGRIDCIEHLCHGFVCTRASRSLNSISPQVQHQSPSHKRSSLMPARELKNGHHTRGMLAAVKVRHIHGIAPDCACSCQSMSTARVSSHSAGG